MDATEEIKTSLSLSVCRGWDRTFLESILQQMEKKKKLTNKQIETLQKVLARNTAEQQKQHENWASVYEEEHKNNATVVAHYYKRQPPYYTAVANDVLGGFVPERVSFLRMMENKYAARILEEYHKDPMYPGGTLVTPRANMMTQHVDFDDLIKLPWLETNRSIEKFKQNGGFIIQVCDKIYSSAKGSKRYKILAIGAKYPFIVEERRIKRKRNR